MPKYVAALLVLLWPTVPAFAQTSPCRFLCEPTLLIEPTITDTRAYTHKLNLELDTAVAMFNRLPESHWLRDVEIEGSLDYVATGLPEGAPAMVVLRGICDSRC